MTLWTDDEHNSAVKYWLEGYSASQIAKLMPGHRSRNAVIGRLHRARVGRDLPSPPSRAPYGSISTRRATAPKAPPKPKAPPRPPLAYPKGVELASVGRPWQSRGRGCAFLVAGEGFGALACCAPGERHTKTGARYCESHAALMFDGCPEPNTSGQDRQRKQRGMYDPLEFLAVAA